MTALTMPSLDRRLLQTVKEEVEAKSVRDWPQESVELCLDLLQKLCGHALNLRHSLERVLSEGVEARPFVVTYSPFVPLVHEWIEASEGLAKRLALAEDDTSRSLTAQLRRLQREYEAFRDLLTEAVSLAEKPSRPVDEDRIRAAEEAYGRGEIKPFYRQR